MPLSYDRIFVRAFQHFSLVSARRTLLPTIGHFLYPRVLPPSSKPALFTMNILPPMFTVWHHFARKSLGDNVDIVLFDCSGTIDPRLYPDVLVQKFLNPRHALKCDRFLHSVARHRRIAWVCDDDVFIVHPDALSVVEREMAIPGTACVSFSSRKWWQIAIGGVLHEPVGTYCLALNADIVARTEHLSFAPCRPNPHPSSMGLPPKCYDSFDKANETLLLKGYRCAVVDQRECERCVVTFFGVSGGVMLLQYFKTPHQVLEYLRMPPLSSWNGNILFRVLSALLTICTIQEVHRRITGRIYPLPSLPSRHELDVIREQVTPYLKEEFSFDPIDEMSAKLLANL